MPNKMLIDASHPEETRVVVVRGNRIEEFDFESQDKKQLKGNIYLARVTRVEPSLQAAFVEYGGNRHGFLAFSEIHPDYYQIPVADRQALLRAEAQEAEDEEDEDGDGDDRQSRDRGRRGRRRGGKSRDRGEHKRDAGEAGEGSGESSEASDNGEGSDNGDIVVEEISHTSEIIEHAADTSEQSDSSEHADASGHDEDSAEQDETETREGGPTSIAAAVEGDVISEPVSQTEQGSEATSGDNDRGMLEEVQSSHPDDHEIESVGAEDALEEVRNRRKPVRRQYKIQEVIKRRQILLVQVVKEERGNKGAALTTYLSLAGRYCGADAEHGARRRHFAQDHQRSRPQAPQGGRRRSRSAAGHGRYPAHRRREPHQGRDQARLRISDAALGERAQSHAPVHRPCPRLRGRQPDQAFGARPLQQGYRRDSRLRRRGLTARPRTSCAC